MNYPFHMRVVIINKYADCNKNQKKNKIKKFTINFKVLQIYLKKLFFYNLEKNILINNWRIINIHFIEKYLLENLIKSW